MSVGLLWYRQTYQLRTHKSKKSRLIPKADRFVPRFSIWLCTGGTKINLIAGYLEVTWYVRYLAAQIECQQIYHARFCTGKQGGCNETSLFSISEETLQQVGRPDSVLLAAPSQYALHLAVKCVCCCFAVEDFVTLQTLPLDLEAHDYMQDNYCKTSSSKQHQVL